MKSNPWLYKVNQHNSTVCGRPGRNFDWSKFDWEGKSVYNQPCPVRTCEHKHEVKAPLPYTDTCLIGPGSQYLHVPYNFAEARTIYRVRPNESMRAGETYRGRLIEKQRAIKKPDGWYWELTMRERR